MDSNHIETSEAKAGSGWTKRLVAGGLAVVLLAGAGAYAATAGDFGSGRGAGMGPGHSMAMQANWRGGPGFSIHRMLDRIEATDEQKDRLEDIFDTVRDEVRPLMREFRDSRKDLAELLGAENVDAAAIETMRAERVAAVDEASKKMTAALVEAANVLTPEQREKLAGQFEGRRGFGRW